MPYDQLDQLPEAVRRHLPEHAQEIYRASFNHALATYVAKKKRHKPEEPLEVICHKVAWSAVKKRYKKQGEHWVEKTEV